MSSLDHRPELRLADKGDLEKIAAFLPVLGGPSFEERFPGKTPLDFCSWKYFLNPLGNAIVGIAVVGPKIVGVVAATPKRIWANGELVSAFELGDFLTAQEYRNQGLFSRLIELVCAEIRAHGGRIIYVRPNELSFPILAGKLSFFEAQRIDSRRFVIPSHAISRMSGIPSSAISLLGIDWLVGRWCIPRQRDASFKVAPIERFGEETDRFWECAAAGYGFVLARDSVYLNWRFADCPTPYKIWVVRRHGEVAGFLVSSSEQKAPVARIVDLFTASNDLGAAQALLSTAMHSFLKEGVRSIATWTLRCSSQSAAHHLLRRACPFRKRQSLHLAFRQSGPEDITLASQGWHFALGDSDGV